MGKHSTSRAPLTAVGIGGTAAGFTALMLAATPAFAAGNCGVTPGSTQVIHHNAITHQVTNTTPGQDEVSYDLNRWSKDVPATPAVKQLQSLFDRQNPGSPAVTHQENQYDRVVPGTPAVKQLQSLFSREHPGSAAVTHTEYQFSKTETVTVPPEGYPTIPNPDYKPAWDETVTVQAAYTDYIKWDWTAPEKDAVAPDGPPPGAGWHQVGTTNDSKGNTPDTIVHAGNGNGSYFYYQSQHHDAVTKVVHHDAVGTPTIPNPDYKPGSTETVTVYRTADGGSSTDEAQAAWFTQSSFSGWNQFDTRTVTDTPATDPYTEYRAQDGSATPDLSQAAWFPLADQTEFAKDGWATFGEVRDTVITPATPDTTVYLVVASDGTQSESPNKSDASWVNPAVTNVDSKWTSFDTRTVTDTPATDPYTEYRAQDGSATPDLSQAAWFPLADQTEFAKDGWATFGEVRDTVITPAQPGYTEYYVHGGDPSKTLTDANWTKDTPEGWKLVDTKHVVVKAAVPPVTTHSTVTDKAAWNETVTTPARDKSCDSGTPVAKTGLAETGFDGTPLIVLGSFVLASGVVITLVARRRRREDGGEA